ncbi:BON domain-containing protein, partial [Desulfocurvibacter africanus]
MRRAFPALRPSRKGFAHYLPDGCSPDAPNRPDRSRRISYPRWLQRHAAASCVLLALLAWGATAWGQVTVQAPRDAAEPARPIPLESAPDDRLETRIRQTFSHIEAFRGIQVDVTDGVVRLSGAAER